MNLIRRRRLVVVKILLIAGVSLEFYFFFVSKTESHIEVRKIANSGIDENELISGKNVFLLDTKTDANKKDEEVELSSRVACAIESAARAENDRKVTLLYASQERFTELSDSPLTDALLSYSNVYFHSANITELSVGSPMEHFFRSNTLASSKHPLEHFSDAARLVVLWKFGGVYIDSDVIVRRSFDSVPSNFVCKLLSEFGNSVMAFSHEGRDLLELFMEEFANFYQPSPYTANGSKIMTRIIQKLCGDENLDRIIKMKSCRDLHLLRDEECYPVNWHDWKDLMTEDTAITEKALRQVSESLLVHFWNHIATQQNVFLKTSSTSAYLILARKYCPEVVKASGEFF